VFNKVREQKQNAQGAPRWIQVQEVVSKQALKIFGENSKT
jgi:hypothetical protein